MNTENEIEHLMPLRSEPEQKPDEKEEHRMTEKRVRALEKARETKRLKKLETEQLVEALRERNDQLESELTVLRTKHDSHFSELENLRKIHTELAMEVKVREAVEKRTLLPPDNNKPAAPAQRNPFQLSTNTIEFRSKGFY